MGRRARGKPKAYSLGFAPLVDDDGIFRPATRPSSADPIYYLASAGTFTALHRLTTDEVHHFYAGDPAELVQIDQAGALTRLILGSDPRAGQQTHVTVTGGSWRGLRLGRGGEWALVGTKATPERSAVEVGCRTKLTRLFPQHRALITRFTR